MIKKKITLSLITSLILTIGFPAGILLIIFGATSGGAGGTVMLVVGIVLTVLGFYGMPISWIKYGEYRAQKNICEQIAIDGIQEISKLASLNNKKENNMLEEVKNLILKRYLLGYEIVDDKYVVPVERKVRSKEDILKSEGKVSTGVCQGCGASVEIVGNASPICPYCGRRVVKK